VTDNASPLRRLDDQRWFGWVTFAIAIVGAVTGVGGLIVAVAQRSDERAVQLLVRSAANGRDYTNEGFGLRIFVVNEGLRGVAVTDARLLLNGRTVGRATGFLPDLRILDRFFIEPAAVTDQQLNLPFSVAPRAERNVALMFADIRSSFPGVEGRRHGPPINDVERRLRGLQRRFELFAEVPSKGRVRLELTLVPGGRRSYIVKRLEGMTPRFQWQIFLDGRGRRVQSISVRRKLAASAQSDLLTLHVYSETGPLVRKTVTRPLIGDTPTSFPLGRLPRGRFVYAFTLAGRVVTGGRFLSEDPCGRGRIKPELNVDDLDFAGNAKPCAQRRP
jgi:hypothetical protein